MIERAMNNDIERLSNGDFEVLPIDRQAIAFDEAGLCKAEPPVPGAVAVYRLGRGHYGLKWEHKGWLMP